MHPIFSQIPSVIIMPCNVCHLLYHCSLTIVIGKMKGIAFVQDPDGYWIEILNGETLVKVTKEFAT